MVLDLSLTVDETECPTTCIYSSADATSVPAASECSPCWHSALRLPAS